MNKTFQLKDIDPIIFSGAGDENIKIIENYFNSKIVLRGNSLIVNGLKKEINEIELLIENIMYTITNKGFIDSKDIDILIKSSITCKSDSKIFFRKQALQIKQQYSSAAKQAPTLTEALALAIWQEISFAIRSSLFFIYFS